MNLNEDKDQDSNGKLVKQEVPDIDDDLSVLLEPEVVSIKSETMPSEDNFESQSLNILEPAGTIKQELFQYEVHTIKCEKLSTAEKLKSTSLSTLEPEDISTASSDIKLEKVAQECNTESIKQELVHEELHIKSEDEVIQEPCLVDLYNYKFTRTINTVKRFKCDSCNYSSALSKADLKKHLRTHTGEKPFKCNVCNKNFGRKETLKVHLLIHTGEKPFQCDICKYSCTQWSSLRYHLTTHTKDKS